MIPILYPSLDPHPLPQALKALSIRGPGPLTLDSTSGVLAEASSSRGLKYVCGQACFPAHWLLSCEDMPVSLLVQGSRETPGADVTQ